MDKTDDRVRITDADFGTGVLAGLAAEKQRTLSVRRLDAKMTAAFEWLESQTEELNLNLRFRISLHEIHQDAPVARNAIRGAVARGLAFADDDHTLYLRIDPEDAEGYFSRLPGTPEMWRKIARIILDTP